MSFNLLVRTMFLLLARQRNNKQGDNVSATMFPSLSKNAEAQVGKRVELERLRFGFQHLYRHLNLSFSQSDGPDPPD